jgi:hypothetical protein
MSNSPQDPLAADKAFKAAVKAIAKKSLVYHIEAEAANDDSYDEADYNAAITANTVWVLTNLRALEAEALAGNKDAKAANAAAKAKADAASPEFAEVYEAAEAAADAAGVDGAKYYYDLAWNETRKAALKAEVLTGSIDAYAAVKAAKAKADAAWPESSHAADKADPRPRVIHSYAEMAYEAAKAKADAAWLEYFKANKIKEDASAAWFKAWSAVKAADAADAADAKAAKSAEAAAAWSKAWSAVKAAYDAVKAAIVKRNNNE